MSVIRVHQSQGFLQGSTESENRSLPDVCGSLIKDRQTELRTSTSTTLTGINARIRWREKDSYSTATRISSRMTKLMYPRVLLKLRPKVVSSQGTGKQRMSWAASGARNEWRFHPDRPLDLTLSAFTEGFFPPISTCVIHHQAIVQAQGYWREKEH